MKTSWLSLAAACVVCLTFDVQAMTHYVDLNCTNPVSPYTNWVTAATNIQDAVDAATNGDLILVTNGVYATGGRVVYSTGSALLTNRVAVTKPVTLQSVNGSAFTMIEGDTNRTSPARCVYLTNDAKLVGFTVTNGSAFPAGDFTRLECGGGAWCESTSAILSNCVLSGNIAYVGGGGAFSGSLINCTLKHNTSVDFYGGGAQNSTLIGCTLSNNSAAYAGGGASYCTLLNCNIIGNSADDYSGGADDCAMTNCSIVGNSAWYGGGASESTLDNCRVSNNWAYVGGGCYDSQLFNCTLSSNWSKYSSVLTGGGGAYGGTLTNCTLRGNTADYDGGGTKGATLFNCTLNGNTAQGYGGGNTGGWLNNCVLNGNKATSGGGTSGGFLNHCMLIDNSAANGGGASGGTLDNCALIGNIATNSFVVAYGGGAYWSVLRNCTLISNSASGYGGGSVTATLTNCISYFNTAPNGPNFSGGTLSFCCTTPLPTNGVGNIVAPPLLVDLAGGDLHLQSNSPCINSGNNACVTSATDFAGNSRIVAGTVDIGAYEYQTPISKISYAWLRQYGLPITTNTDAADPDDDSMNNWQEWMAGTDPANALSLLEMLSLASTNSASGIVVTWQSVTNRSYFLQSSTNLSVQPTFSTIQSNIIGQPGTTTYTDASATNSDSYFYRVGVQ